MLKVQINILPNPGLFIQSLPLSIHANVFFIPQTPKRLFKELACQLIHSSISFTVLQQTPENF